MSRLSEHSTIPITAGWDDGIPGKDQAAQRRWNYAQPIAVDADVDVGIIHTYCCCYWRAFGRCAGSTKEIVGTFGNTSHKRVASGSSSMALIYVQVD